MNKVNKNIINSCNKKTSKDIICTNLSPKMRDPAFQINYTLKKYLDKKLNENTYIIDKDLFKKKNKKLKSFNGIINRNKGDSRDNRYLASSVSKEKLQIFSGLQNISISIVHSNKKNNNKIESKLFKNMTNRKRDNHYNRVFSYTKINNKNNNTSKNYSKEKFHLSGKISPVRTKRIFSKLDSSSNISNIIKDFDNNIFKNSVNKNSFAKTLYRFNSSDLNNKKTIDYNTNNLSDKKSIKNYVDNNLALSQRIHNSNNNNKNQINKNSFLANKDKKIKKQTKIKGTKNYKNKNNNNRNLYNNNNNCNKKNKIGTKKNDKKKNIYFNEIKTNNIDNKKSNNNKINNENDVNNYYIQNIEKKEKTESNPNNNNVLNIHVNDKKILDGYELCWNLKNDYSKDIDISLISINNQKKSFIKNYKLKPDNYSNIFKDNNNINNIYLNNIQNVNNINHKQENSNNHNNKVEYYSKLELLENENKILKDEIKESKNRISILENKIEELLDDKNCKEDIEVPQPMPYVVKYSKDFLFNKIKPTIDEQNQIKNNDIIKENSKNETKESEISNKIINKNEE